MQSMFYLMVFQYQTVEKFTNKIIITIMHNHWTQISNMAKGYEAPKNYENTINTLIDNCKKYLKPKYYY